MSQNVVVLGARYLLIDLLGGIVFFPLWWYTRGLVKMAKFILGSIREEQQTLGIWVWVKNIFVPMYGAYDIWGRIISFFMRSVQIIARTVFLSVYVFLMGALFLAYLVLPVVIIWQCLINFFGTVFFTT